MPRVDSRSAVSGRLAAVDLAGLRLARTLGHTPCAERAVRAFSALGQHGGLWLALGIGGAALDPTRRAHWHRATRAVVLADAVNQAVKLAVHRRRPQLPDLPPLIRTPTQLSFPSAHSATSAAAAQAFRHLMPVVPLRATAAAMAASRLYLGVHYPSDIVAGMLLGAVIGKQLGPTPPTR